MIRTAIRGAMMGRTRVCGYRWDACNLTRGGPGIGRLERQSVRCFASRNPNISSYDVIVIGMGAMGSSILNKLAQANCKVLGIESHDVGHSYGSSHGLTRIIRRAYTEDSAYVPLVLRAYELWQQLEEESEQKLLHTTGGFDIGGLFDGALKSAKTHGIKHEVLTGEQVNKEYGAYNLPMDTPVLFQPQGGILESEEAIYQTWKVAKRKGATIRKGERVFAWGKDGSGVKVETQKGTYYAQFLVIAAGSWVPTLVPSLKSVLTVERQVVGWHWAKESGQLFESSSFPVFALELDNVGMWYGLPAFQREGMKLGKYHHLGEVVHPDAVNRNTEGEDIELFTQFTKEVFPLAERLPYMTSVCLFTNTPDGHFIIDRHPKLPQVVLCSPCSGHGFKFAPAIGEMVGTMLTEEKAQELDLFKVDRPALKEQISRSFYE